MLHLCARREGYFCVTSCCVGGEGWCAGAGGAFSATGKGCKLEKAGKGGPNVRAVSGRFCRCLHPFIPWPLTPAAEKGKERNKKIFPVTYKSSARAFSLHYIYTQDKIFLYAEALSHVDAKCGIADNLICRKCRFLHIHSAVIFLFPFFRTLIGQELDKQKQSYSPWANTCKILEKKKKKDRCLQVSELGCRKTEVP